MGEVEKEEREKAEAAAESQMVKAPDFVAPDKEDWGADAAVTDWAADGQPAAAPVAAPAAIVAPGAAAPAVAPYQVTEDWAAQTETSDWAAASANPAESQQGNSWEDPRSGDHHLTGRHDHDLALLPAHQRVPKVN